MMFLDGFDAFWLSRPPFGSLIILHEACRCLVVCKRGSWGLSRFRHIWSEKITRKKRCPLRLKRCEHGLPVLYRVRDHRAGIPLGYQPRFTPRLFVGGGRKGYPPPTPPPPFVTWPYLQPIDPKSKISYPG